ncbi:MAG: pyridoxamine 5'-phosphate oxidase family protein [Clostridia bacterium]|nr:pyridoxamine 5'-phosphate oxidase family protein [Clostridia bacterium]
MNEVYDFLKAAGTYFLATTENGEPRVRPFGTIDIWDGKLTIQTGLKKDVAKQMLANPRVEISAFVPAEGKWIRLSADASLVDDIRAAEHMLDAYPSLKAMYAPGDGNTAIFALTNGTAAICSFTAAPVVYPI